MMPMTKRYLIISLAAVIMLVTASAMILSKKNNSAPGSDILPVALHALKMNDGWGYEVRVDNKVYIHQDCIPAISSFKKFNSESEALLIGKRVVDKIKLGHKPTITLQDISEAHIHY
jgi:Domain of unknown function (DUF4907)